MYAVEDNLLEVLSKFKPKWKRIGLRLKEEVEVSAVKLNLSCNKCLWIELPQTEFYLSEQAPPGCLQGKGLSQAGHHEDKPGQFVRAGFSSHRSVHSLGFYTW